MKKSSITKTTYTYDDDGRVLTEIVETESDDGVSYPGIPHIVSQPVSTTPPDDSPVVVDPPGDKPNKPQRGAK